jgi:hypothetical protein
MKAEKLSHSPTVMLRSVILSFSVVLLLCNGCVQQPATEKYQSSRDVVVHVKDKMREIVVDDVLIGDRSNLYLLNEYLIAKEVKVGMAWDKFVHIFDKNTFKYLTSTAPYGDGPGEITNFGTLGIDAQRRTFYVSDNGKYRIFGYCVDSVLRNPDYKPYVKMDLNKKAFPIEYQYLNDSLSFGVIMQPTSVSTFDAFTGKWNMNTGDITPVPYENPKIERRRIHVAVSTRHNLYAEAYYTHDLITICDLNGTLKCNVYGPEFTDERSFKTDYFTNVLFCKEKILALYSGISHRVKDSYTPTTIMVFDLNGDYIKTLDVGYRMFSCCYDADNNRLLMSLNEEMMFAYLELDGLL